MTRSMEGVPLVRCRLDGDDAEGTLRLVAAEEFELWRHFMETRHGRTVTVEEVSTWIPEQAAWWNSGFSADELVPVLRLRYERLIDGGIWVPLERFFPAETYPKAQEALLAHFDERARIRPVSASPGYLVRPGALRGDVVRMA